jgi:hypothetical protein
MRSHANGGQRCQLVCQRLEMEPGMNGQLYTSIDVMRLPTGGRAKFLRTTALRICQRTVTSDRRAQEAQYASQICASLRGESSRMARIVPAAR